MLRPCFVDWDSTKNNWFTPENHDDPKREFHFNNYSPEEHMAGYTQPLTRGAFTIDSNIFSAACPLAFVFLAFCFCLTYLFLTIKIWCISGCCSILMLIFCPSDAFLSHLLLIFNSSLSIKINASHGKTQCGLASQNNQYIPSGEYGTCSPLSTLTKMWRHE